jgi:hypothetical protein
LKTTRYSRLLGHDAGRLTPAPVALLAKTGAGALTVTETCFVASPVIRCAANRVELPLARAR